MMSCTIATCGFYAKAALKQVIYHNSNTKNSIFIGEIYRLVDIVKERWFKIYSAAALAGASILFSCLLVMFKITEELLPY